MPMVAPTFHLIAAAEALEKQAITLRRTAEAIERQIARQKEIEQRLETFRIHGEKIARAAQFDAALIPEILETLPDHPNCPRETALFWAKEAVQAERKAAKKRRDREITRLARTHTNAEIARLMGLSKGTISKIISASFRQQTGQFFPRRD